MLWLYLESMVQEENLQNTCILMKSGLGCGSILNLMCEIIGFDTVNDKAIIYNGVNFNYEVVRTLEIKDFIEEYGDTLLFCAGKYNVSWRKVGYTLNGYKECDYRNFIKILVCK